MKFDLRLKLIGYTFCVILLVGGAISLLSVHYGRQRIMASFQENARTITALIARGVVNDLYFLDVRSLRLQLQNARLNPDIRYTYLMDAEGVVLTDGTPENPLRDQSMTDDFSRDIRRSDDWVSREERGILQVGGPILMPDGSRVGYLRVGFSLGGISRIARDATRSSLVLTLICLGIGAILAFIVSTTVSRPITAIMEAARRIGGGNLDTRVPVRRADELGMLAESINQMAASLRAVTVSKSYVENTIKEITQELELATLLALVTRRAAEMVGVVAGAIFLWDESTHVLVPQAWHGLGDWFREVRIRLGEGIAGTVAARREGLIVNEYRTSPYSLPVFRGRMDMTAVLCEPLLYRDRLVGVLAIHTCETGRQFTEVDRETLALLASQAAIAIENARLYGELQHELSQRQEAEAHIRRLAHALEQSPNVVMITDAQGAIEYVNPKFTQVTGYTLEEVLGQNPRILKSGETPSDAYRQLWETITGGAEWRGEFHNKKKSGALYWELASISAIRDPEGRITNFVAVKEDITEHKRAVENLRVLGHALEGIAEIVTVTDLDDRFTFVNQAFLEAYGYTRDEVLGQHVSLVWSPSNPSGLHSKILWNSRVRGWKGELFNRTKTGLDFPIALSTSQIRDHTGKVLGLVGVAEDITERRRAAEALLVRTRQLEAVRSVTAEIAHELDLGSLLALIHQKVGELVSMDTGVVWLWDEAAQVLIPRAWHGLGAWLGNVRLRLGEGVVGTVAQHRKGMIVNDFRSSPYATPLFLERTSHTAVLAAPLLYGDRLVGVININTAETKRSFTAEDQQLLALFAAQSAIAIENARSHTAVVRQKEELGALLRATRSVMSGLDLQEILDRIVMEAAEISGCPHVKVTLVDKNAGVFRVRAAKGTATPIGYQRPLGTGLSGLVIATGQAVFSPDSANDPRNLLALQDRNLGIVTYLGLPIKIRDEVVGTLSFHTTAPRQHTPEELAYLTSFADQAAVAIENANLFAELNQSYEALQQAQEELIRAEKLRALGQMAAGIAHDLNNMLAAVLGQAELLRLRASEPEAQAAVNILTTAAADAAHVVRRLQGFARQRPITPLGPCSLPPLVEETVELTRPRWKDEAQRRGAVITVRTVLAECPPILGHPAEIREALTNLILNAVDAMPEGGILTLAARPVTDDRRPGDDAVSGPPSAVTQFVELTVTDTGTGMPEEVRRNIFEPFFTTKGGKGTGLGLAVVYGILERHGGHITVASTPKVGTTITLRFRAAPQGMIAASVAPLPLLAPRRLLLIDDDRVVRRTVADLLRTAGHTVMEADGGAAGLACLAAEPVALVLTDLGMPEMTGWDVAQQVKATWPHLPVILLTGWGDQVSVESAPDRLVDRVLSKPVRLMDLLGVIADLTEPPPQGAGGERGAGGS